MAILNTFFIAGYEPLQHLIKETIRRFQFMVQVMGFFSVLIKETIRRLQVMVQVMGLFSILIEETIMRLQGSSEFSSKIKSSDRPMRGRDLIMWSEGQWQALKKLTWKGDINAYPWTSQLLDRIGPVGRFGENVWIWPQMCRCGVTATPGFLQPCFWPRLINCSFLFQFLQNIFPWLLLKAPSHKILCPLKSVILVVFLKRKWLTKITKQKKESLIFGYFFMVILVPETMTPWFCGAQVALI